MDKPLHKSYMKKRQFKTCDIVYYISKKILDHKNKVITMMELLESVFRHEALDTVFLDFTIDEKNKIYGCDRLITPFTLGTFPADQLPEGINLHCYLNYNWISNINDSLKPGKHWVCILLNKTIPQRKDLIQAECVNSYYIIDSWGSTFYQKICETIMNTLTDNYNEQLKDHAEYMQNRQLKC